MPGKVEPDAGRGADAGLRARVFGNQATITFAGSQGQFELNVYRPVMAHAALESIRLLGDAVTSFTDNLVVGLEPRRENLRAGVERSLMLVTALAPDRL